jgi:nitronate monooxygenase
MRTAAGARNDVGAMQAWAGQSAALARTEPAGDLVRRAWDEAESLLP